MAGRPFDFSKAVRDEARVRQAGKCAHCGDALDDLEEHAHHVIPNQSGDPDNPTHDWLRSLDNCVVLCAACHGMVHEDSQFQRGAVAPPEYYVYSHGRSNAAQHGPWVAMLNERANALFSSVSRAAGQVVLLIDQVQRQINLNKGENTQAINDLTVIDTSSWSGIGRTARGIAGFATNTFFNSLPPQLTIWLPAEASVLRVRSLLREGRVTAAATTAVLARFQMLLAVKKFANWQDGLFGTSHAMGAGTKMYIAIPVTGVAIVLATVGLCYAVPAIVSAGTAAPAAVPAATAIVRLGALVAAAEQKFRIAEIAIEELEEEVESIRRYASTATGD